MVSAKESSFRALLVQQVHGRNPAGFWRGRARRERAGDCRLQRGPCPDRHAHPGTRTGTAERKGAGKPASHG